MAIARFQLEDGTIARFEVPEGTTPEQAQVLVEQFIQDEGLPTKAQQAPTATPDPTVQQEGPGIGTFIAGAPEVALSMISGAITEPIAGIAGIASTLASGPEAGAETVRAVQEAGTFQPRSKVGQQTAQALGRTIEPLGELISAGEEFIGGGTLEATGSPALAAAAVAVPTAILELFGLKAFRAARKVPRGPLITPDGVPTPELEAVLRETGGSFEDLTKEATDFIATQSTSTDPAQVARAARFEAQGIPATRGDISQEFGQQAAEAKLISAGVDEAGEPLRQFRLDQSEVFKSKVNELVDSLGVPADVGTSVKDALTGRKDLLTKEKNALYRQVADAAPEIANIPIITDTIADAMLSPAEVRRASRFIPGQMDGLSELLVEFGIDKSTDAVKAFADAGGEIIPLTLANFDEFRKAVGNIQSSDMTRQASRFTGPILRALDEEASLVGAAIDARKPSVGPIDANIVETLKEARGRVRTIKTEFSPQAISGRLIDTKRDGVTPVIEASRVSRQLLSPTAPIEDLKRTLQSLSSAGKKGSKAIKDLQASVVLNALEDALNAPSRKTSGIQTIGGNQFAKSLEKFGDDKLDLLFKGNPKDLARLRGLKQTARDITPTSGAVPKGSAPVIMDLLKRTGRVPGLAPIMDAINLVVKAGADDRAVARALRSKPEARRILEALEQDFPSLTVALAIPQLMPDSSSEQVESN